MFGYILPLNGELKVKEFNYFKSYYCGLCNTIKNKFGNIPRLTLNYDLTFISFLLDGLSKDQLDLTTKRCLRHPKNDILIVKPSPALEYCASLSFILFNHKLQDNILDDNNLKSKCYYHLLNPYNRKLPKEINTINSIIKNNLLIIGKLEISKDFTSLDEISHYFGVIMGSILKECPYKLNDDSNDLRNNLYDLGYNLGKWIYLIDARDDLKDDMKNNSFNPILVLENKEKFLNYEEISLKIGEDYEFILLSLISRCKEILNLLPLQKHKDIIANVLDLGLVNKTFNVLSHTS